MTLNPAVFFVPFVVTFLCIIILRPVALAIGLIDNPSDRKNHGGEIPLIGGVSIYVAAVFTSVLSDLKDFSLTDLWLAATLLVVVGVLDDIKGLSVSIRFTVQLLVGCIMIFGGGLQIQTLGDLLGFGDIQLDAWSVAFTLFAVSGSINAFNMIDGIDGLAGSLSLVFFILLGILSLSANTWTLAAVCFGLASASGAFLVFNLRAFGRQHASVFLGDAGSMLIGFIIAWMAISLSQGERSVLSPVTILWIFLVPIFDTVAIMVRRICNGNSPFRGDSEHFHHILCRGGYTINQSVLIVLSVSLAMAIVGIIMDVAGVPDWLMFYGFFFLFVFYYRAMSNAWKMVKTINSIRERRIQERRLIGDRRVLRSGAMADDRRILADRRSGIDRRSVQNIHHFQSEPGGCDQIYRPATHSLYQQSRSRE